MRRYILFHGKTHPEKLDENAVGSFLTHLADARACTSATQSQALCALVFMYKHALSSPLKNWYRSESERF
ncbi:MAG: phage integrase N-terminal SAM-like domain-containing protein [Granulosicoccaceae bacterium]